MSGKHLKKTSLKKEIGPHVKKKKRTYIFGLLGLWLALGLVVGAIYLLSQQGPLQSKDEVTATVTIPKGFNSSDIAKELAEEGIITNAFTFRIFATLNNIDETFLPGEYLLNSEMSYEEIAEILSIGPEKEMVSFVIPEGFTMDQVNSRLAKVFERDKSEFESITEGDAVNNYDFSELPMGAINLEGYLFPKTYSFEKDTESDQVIEKLLRQYQLETGSLDWSFAEQKALSKKEIVIIASLIEKEAKVPEERPLMAAVIYNRMAIGMPLQIDATIQYVLPERKTILTNKDTKYDSPYNTYLHQGLPPGPISNPGIDSLKAALAPAQVDYLYYVLTSPDGSHTFTRSYDEFLRAKKKMN